MIFYRFDVSLQSLLDYFEARYDILYFQKVRNIRCPLAPAQLRKQVQPYAWTQLADRNFPRQQGQTQRGRYGGRLTHIKKVIHSKMDHANLNEIFDFNPTAENIGKWIVEQFDTCYKVNIQESFGNTATVIDENKIKGIEFIVK